MAGGLALDHRLERHLVRQDIGRVATEDMPTLIDDTMPEPGERLKAHS